MFVQTESKLYSIAIKSLMFKYIDTARSCALSDKQDLIRWNRKRGNTDGARLESSSEDSLQTSVYFRTSRTRNTDQKRIRGKKNVESRVCHYGYASFFIQGEISDGLCRI